MNKLGSDISSSEDELLTGEKNYSPIDRRDFKNEFKFDKDDDRMSMSSLSSTEDAKIDEVRIKLGKKAANLNKHPFSRVSLTCLCSHRYLPSRIIHIQYLEWLMFIAQLILRMQVSISQ